MFQFVRIITHPLYSVNEGVLKFFEEEFIPFFKEEDSKKKEKLYADLLRDINLKIKQKAENFFKKLDLDVKLDSCGTVIATKMFEANRDDIRIIIVIEYNSDDKFKIIIENSKSEKMDLESIRDYINNYNYFPKPPRKIHYNYVVRS